MFVKTIIVCDVFYEVGFWQIGSLFEMIVVVRPGGKQGMNEKLII